MEGSRGIGGQLVCDVSKHSAPHAAFRKSQSLLVQVVQPFHTQLLKRLFPCHDCSWCHGVSGSQCASYRPGSSLHEFRRVPLFNGNSKYVSSHSSADTPTATSITSSVFQTTECLHLRFHLGETKCQKI